MQAVPIRSLAVFCGSKYGATPLFTEHAIELGRIMVAHNVTLVYGGGNVGIMGTIADTVMSLGGKAIGVIPQVLVEWERQHNALSELFIADDMHSRKKKMYELCDAAIILPGGFGTLDEMFEMITWNQLSIHDKQIFVLNSKGFYDHLIAHIQQMEKEKFLYEAAQKRLRFINEPSDMISYF
ncbi:MAG TPA: TIGR00730 family Rossman fold protein [Chitinophagaceae bacterium]|nr:TIGR00730 family Rossman fold protein [Chitinophagaceae bacterium]